MLPYGTDQAEQSAVQQGWVGRRMLGGWSLLTELRRKHPSQREPPQGKATSLNVAFLIPVGHFRPAVRNHTFMTCAVRLCYSLTNYGRGRCRGVVVVVVVTGGLDIE